ncbi:hypothetical protein AAZX31_16G095800 [Glycine max]|uniref:Uncharacterized protein n=2 Tax=Glycine subgen. Soja TaxID=1462606 RepID=I1MMJ5_SOYBN|nr:uncharacterized protein LOC100812984 isoform X1 [Glycine max]XP_028208132.1 uncharacterized protein LOC114391264 isoform X1 [Glycine soja]KAG4938923.1 hypothetical protein JHK86_045064 [Glycine max]KAH1150858.1 hypothetical protein GYH30_044730 [Glycine max]KRH07703.1 hypothetical protein GLYMA_16G105200v4 [Glycine max]RZB60463.1 hypothetical protein D0Y65_043296 [Glycine soja]|eukprot:XP_003548712.1 uncharacterized protein LOC100812984 isoform X1 [Glycine max]
MIELFLSEPNWNDVVNDDDSTRSRISILNDLETVIWSTVGRSEARLWLCNTVAGLNCVTSLDQRDLFRNLLRTSGVKRDLASQLLHLMFDTAPHKPGSVLARRSHVLNKFFQGNPKRVLQWFSCSSSGGGLEQGKGFRALSQFAFKNRDICWEELEWKGKHGQSPAVVATKPHYFLDLDVLQTVENFLENVPEFWSSEEFAESVKDGDIFFVDRSFFVRYFINLMYKEEFRDVWDVVNEFLMQQAFSSLCGRLLITLEDQDLCHFVESLCKSLGPKLELKHFNDVSNLFVIVLFKCGSYGSIDQLLLFNAVMTQGRQLLRLLRDEEAWETQEKINEIVSKMSAIPNNPNSLTPIFKSKYKMKIIEVIKYLGLLSWLLYYRLSKECQTPESWESVFMNNQIGFRNSNKHALSDEDGPSEEDCSVRVKGRRKKKARKKRRTYDRHDDGDDELLDYDSASQKLVFPSNTRSWLLSTDGYSSAWSSVDLPEYLHRHCLSRWMTWLFEK